MPTKFNLYRQTILQRFFTAVRFMRSHPRKVEQGFEQDRRDYWAMRDELLRKYAGQWVAVHNGQVVAVGDDAVSIMERALSEDGYAYTNRVGEEDKIIVRERRVSFMTTPIL